MEKKKQINSNTIIVRNFNMPLTSMDRCPERKINKETALLKDTLDQMDLIDIFIAFHSKEAEYTFFSSTHGAFSRIEHMLRQISNLRLKSYRRGKPRWRRR